MLDVEYVQGIMILFEFTVKFLLVDEPPRPRSAHAKEQIVYLLQEHWTLSLAFQMRMLVNLGVLDVVQR
jgi:hypothetical protein